MNISPNHLRRENTSDIGDVVDDDADNVLRSILLTHLSDH